MYSIAINSGKHDSPIAGVYAVDLPLLYDTAELFRQFLYRYD